MSLSKPARFGQVPVDVFVEENLESRKTKETTEFAVRVLLEFLSSGRNRPMTALELGMLSPGDLCSILQDFYANVRNSKGELYSKSSLLCIRHGISRHLKSKNVTFDITKDTQFAPANRVFMAMLRNTRAQGKGHVEHKPPVTPGDMRKLYTDSDVFDVHSPQGLLHKVWFEIQLYFCRRGRENLRELKATDFAVAFDDNGQKYIRKVTSERTKNHQGDKPDEDYAGGRMFATGNSFNSVVIFM